MKFFKKKAKKKPVKKKPVTKLQAPKQWKPPFPGAGFRAKMKTVNDSNPVAELPKLLEAPPTYSFPTPSKSDLDSDNRKSAETFEAKETVRPREQKARKEFLKVFRELTYRWRSWDIWADFVTMTACALSNAADKLHYDEREKTYLRIINKYNKKEQQLFPELFAHLVIALEENPEQDFLGDVYTELGLNSKDHKQIFTPYHVAHMMAEITIGDVEKQIEEQGVITVHDCCCGGGVTLIAAANVVKEKLAKTNLNYQNHLLVTGQDIDYVVAMMCYIQISLHGIAGYFKVGNAITEPMSRDNSPDNYWFTPMYFFPVWHLRRIFRSLDDLFQTEQKIELK